MGKTEKIVVLSVLFAVVVLFVWSLQGPEARAAAAGGDPTAPTTDEPADSANVFQRATTKPRPDDGRYRCLVRLISEDGCVAPHRGCIAVV